MIINQHLSTNYFAARTGITSDIKDAITLIIENRPEDPIAFMAELWVSRSASSDLRVYKNWKFYVSINNIFLNGWLKFWQPRDHNHGTCEGPSKTAASTSFKTIFPNQPGSSL